MHSFLFKMRWASLLGLSLLGLSSLSHARFEAGTFRVGGGIGLRGSSEGTLFSIGASGGIFVLKGLEVGLAGVFQTGANTPAMFMLTLDSRFIPLPNILVSPYVRGAGGRLFVEGDGAWIGEAGGGLLYLVGNQYGVDLGAGYRWLVFPNNVFGSYYLQGGILVWF